MIQTSKHPYELLASYLHYPHEGDVARLREHLPELERLSRAAGKQLSTFLDHGAQNSVPDREELFTRTFDINPTCTLELGWILYGQDYARGAFLVKMRQMLSAQEIPENGELPDHLTHVLLLLGRLPDDTAASFVTQEVMPGVTKMRESFKEKDNPYARVIEAVWIVLTERYGTQTDSPV
jgi:nitrate reductase molybdenum cofactor assembly chaperone NarJ/NarW